MTLAFVYSIQKISVQSQISVKVIRDYWDKKFKLLLMMLSI